MLSATTHESSITKVDQLPAKSTPPFLELEITGFCQLKCVHCYSESGPDSGHGSMTATDWERVLDGAATAGVKTVQFIGGEPTLYPELRRLVRYALGKGIKVYVYSNLVHVTPDLWEIFSLPGVSLGTSWYTTNSGEHAKITRSLNSYARTKANIIEAIRRGIPLSAGIVQVTVGQDSARAEADLRALGVTSIRVDRARGVGRAARGRVPVVSELCGQCGRGRAAIGLDGQVTPCVLGRFLVAGNVKDAPLDDILESERWQQILASIPPLDACVTCTPADSNDCNPARKP
jgi:MoaA/NifB/PqqE/SkfB family radical SAM enzyme